VEPQKAQECFHCGDALPPRQRFEVVIDGESRQVCCPGCQAVAELIASAGFADFYRFRETPAQKPDPDDRNLAQWTVYDRPELQREFVAQGTDGICEAGLIIEGVRCAACSWLIERGLEHEPGLESVEVNPASARARLRWDPQQIPLSRLLARLAALGYRPHPASPDIARSSARREQRAALKRLAVAGLGMMQVMMFAVALYAGAFQGMDPAIENFLRLVSLLVATPVAIYSGGPFFAGAWRDLRARSAGMDVPVALAIGGAYIASVWNSLRGSGEVYFDSVTMFVFFLSLGRFLEMTARHRAGTSADAIARLQPTTAMRIDGDRSERVGIAELQVGELVRVRPGEVIPCDGIITSGSSGIDEAMLTGESRPVLREPGDPVTGGSVNINESIEVEIRSLGADSVLAGISRLLHRAQSERPRLAQLADRVASRFVGAVLVIAILVGAYWWHAAPEDAFRIVLSVLVVTCPCALSLATPATLTAAIGALARKGMLVCRGAAIETLAQCDRVVFDKTGTLTTGQQQITRSRFAAEPGANRAMAIATALEAHSAHPIAHAFAADATQLEVTDARAVAGGGICGSVAGKQYKIGKTSFACDRRSEIAALIADQDGGASSWIVLSEDDRAIAAFELADSERTDSAAVLADLRDLGLELEIASGDSAGPVTRLAERLGIDAFHYRLTPAQKLELIRERQHDGETVAVIGDGVNDAPVLAGADVSVAMGEGARLAQTSADIVLLGASLRPVVYGFTVARRAMRIVRQNLGWALGYNAIALPVAASGIVQPWMAAIGMSTSSLLVVLNAMRAGRDPEPPRIAADHDLHRSEPSQAVT
jgi:Cu2+-exporting ATPase